MDNEHSDPGGELRASDSCADEVACLFLQTHLPSTDKLYNNRDLDVLFPPHGLEGKIDVLIAIGYALSEMIDIAEGRQA